MTPLRWALATLLLSVVASLSTGCEVHPFCLDCAEDDGGPDADADTLPTDGDVERDGDADSDAETDGDADAEAETDAWPASPPAPALAPAPRLAAPCA